MHFMGTPEETRHIAISDRQAVISPSWSIHCACGTASYAFCWGMGSDFCAGCLRHNCCDRIGPAKGIR